MADAPRTLDEIKAYLDGQPALKAGESFGLLKEVVHHLIRQQKEIDDLKRGGSGTASGTPIVRSPNGNVYF